MIGNRRSTGLAVIAAFTLAASGVTACGGSIGGICDEICDCEGCSDSEYDDCVDEFEDVERNADREGCLDQYDDVIACIDEEIECRSGDIDYDGCGPEQKDLNDCLD